MHSESRLRLTAIAAAASLAVANPACDRRDDATTSTSQREAVSSEDRLVYESVEEVVAEILGSKAPEITPDSRFFEDLGADSLDTVEMVMALEDEFDLMIADEAAAKMVKVSDVTAYISRVLAQRAEKIK